MPKPTEKYISAEKRAFKKAVKQTLPEHPLGTSQIPSNPNANVGIHSQVRAGLSIDKLRYAEEALLDAVIDEIEFLYTNTTRPHCALLLNIPAHVQENNDNDPSLALAQNYLLAQGAKEIQSIIEELGLPTFDNVEHKQRHWNQEAHANQIYNQCQGNNSDIYPFILTCLRSFKRNIEQIYTTYAALVEGHSEQIAPLLLQCDFKEGIKTARTKANLNLANEDAKHDFTKKFIIALIEEFYNPYNKDIRDDLLKKLLLEVSGGFGSLLQQFKLNKKDNSLQLGDLATEFEAINTIKPLPNTTTKTSPQQQVTASADYPNIEESETDKPPLEKQSFSYSQPTFFSYLQEYTQMLSTQSKMEEIYKQATNLIKSQQFSTPTSDKMERLNALYLATKFCMNKNNDNAGFFIFSRDWWKDFVKEIRPYANQVWEAKADDIINLNQRMIFLKNLEAEDLPVLADHKSNIFHFHLTSKTNSQNNDPNTSYSESVVNFFKNLSVSSKTSSVDNISGRISDIQEKIQTTSSQKLN